MDQQTAGRACSPFRRMAARPSCGLMRRGRKTLREWKDPQTLASGLRVPAAIGDFLILDAVRKSRGAALAVSDADMLAGVREIAETEGMITSPEGGATLAGLKKMLADGFLGGHESIVLFLTAAQDSSTWKHWSNCSRIARGLELLTALVFKAED